MVKDLNDPTNRDSVPAMLTPGEFVLNKEATAMYGPIIEQMNNNGLKQRHQENQMVKANIGKKISKLHGEGYKAPGQAYAIAKSMGYNVGGLVKFLKEKEGWEDKAYQDDAGVWTIGYGRTTNPDGSPIKPGQKTTREVEDSWLVDRATQERNAVQQYADQFGYNFSPNQLDALASFRYNAGHGALQQLTDNGKRDLGAIQKKLPLYNKITDPKTGKKVPLKGLTNRRNAELELWGTPGKRPKARPEQEEAELVPPTEAPPGFAEDAVNQVAQAYFQPPQPIQVQAPQLAQINPEYIPSVTEQKRQSFWNRGGPVEYLNVGGRRRKKRGGPAVGHPGITSYVGGGRNNPRANIRAPLQPTGPEIDRSLNPLPTDRDPNINRFNQEMGRLTGQASLALGPQEAGVPPAIDNLPPVPGSDEAILQNSSQQVEAQESNQGKRRTEASGPAVDHPGTTSYTGGGRNTPRVSPTAPPQPAAPSSYVGGGRNTTREERPEVTRQAPGLEAPTLEEQAPKMSQEERDAAGQDLAKTRLAEANVPPAEQLADKNPDDVAVAGEARLKENPKAANTIKRQLKEGFGDLIDGKELARMAVLFLGARATGASAGQALAYAGQNYIARIDAKQNAFNKLATSGKYTPQSLKEYKQTGDITTLAPVGVAPERTGKFVTRYDSKSGKPVQLEEVKVGDNVLLQDAQGNVRSGFEFASDPSEVRGSPEYRTRVKASQGQITTQLEEMRQAFDVFKTDKGEGAKTDILPATNSAKIAEWAIDNGVSPDELGGLVESAYHDALNDQRQDGSRARNLVPYLQQLVIRQSVGGNANVFQSKEQPKEGPPSYVNPQKLQKLNRNAGFVLKQLGHQGGVQDLANIFYTEALKDWNALDKETKEQWNRKALADESGFYKFADNMLTQGVG